MEKKSKPSVHQVEENIWKSKPSQAPSNLFGAGQPGRPGVQRGGVSLSTSIPNYNAKKGFNNLKRRQLLDFLAKTQPSSVMWDKAWKYNKPLPSPEEGAPAVSDWGKCWMFATRQPYSEDGKMWLNGPNTMDPQTLRLWNRSDHIFERSQWQNVNLPAEAWGMSWKKYDKNNHKGATPAHQDFVKSRLSALLDEAQHGDVVEEWIKSWKSIKQASQLPNDSHTSDFAVNRQEKREEVSCDSDCWRLVNHHGVKRSNSHQVQRSYNPEWADSWKVATVVTSNDNDSAAPVSHDHKESFNDHCQQQRDSSFHKVLRVANKLKRRDEHEMVSCDESKLLSEWAKSWHVAKNNSKPCEEIENVLKASFLRREANLREEMNNKKISAAEKMDHCNQHTHAEIHQPKRELTKMDKLYRKQPDNVLSATEWKDSCKMLRSRRIERRRVRNDPLKSLGSFDKERQTEWADMWKCNSLPLRQEPELWQQHWPTVAPVRVDRARVLNHFTPVELPKNGPTGESIYGASWKCFSPQCRPAPGRGAGQSDHVLHPGDRHRGFAGVVADWQGARIVSNSQSHHDRPSWTLWGEAWRWSLLNTPSGMREVSPANEVDMVLEIRAGREIATTMSGSLDSNLNQEKCPEEQWRSSWKASSLLSHKQSLYGSSAAPMPAVTQQQHTSADGHESKWGLPFRLANPMPHIEQPWVESSSNMCHNAVMWARKVYMQANLNISSSSNYAVVRLWANSHQFLQGSTTKRCKDSVDPMVIVRKKTKTKGHLFSKMEKQSERKWAGCHLLGKTQPRPKRGPGSVKKLDLEDDNKFQEEWGESWRHLIVKMKMPTKSLSGWVESWRFLIPLYKGMNGLKAK